MITLAQAVYEKVFVILIVFLLQLNFRYIALLNDCQCIILSFTSFFLCHRVVTLVKRRYFLKYLPAYLTNRDTVRHGLLVGQNAHRY